MPDRSLISGGPPETLQYGLRPRGGLAESKFEENLSIVIQAASQNCPVRI